MPQQQLGRSCSQPAVAAAAAASKSCGETRTAGIAQARVYAVAGSSLRRVRCRNLKLPTTGLFFFLFSHQFSVGRQQRQQPAAAATAPAAAANIMRMGEAEERERKEERNERERDSEKCSSAVRQKSSF